MQLQQSLKASKYRLVITGFCLIANVTSGCAPSAASSLDRRFWAGNKPGPNTSETTPQTNASIDAVNNSNLMNAARLNSFRPGDTWLDTEGQVINAHGGGFYVENGVYYWFGELKGQDGLARAGISLYSSTDLYNWRNEGLVLAVDKTNPDSDIAEGAIIERPKVIFNKKTQKYVMWFHLELKGQGYGSARAGVAVSDTVRGPYRFLTSFRPNNAMSRDQTLFVDDNGKAYQIAASEENQTMHINELTDDYLKPNGKFVRTFIGRSMEAPAVFKYKGRYHLIASGCTGWDPNSARQAVADNMMGPWTELDNPAQGPESDLTFRSQSTYVLEVTPGSGQFIYIGDRWNPDNLADSRYIWLPLKYDNGRFTMRWQDEWQWGQALPVTP